MIISIIVPLYKGKKYINNILDMVRTASSSVDAEIEIIFINDYPLETINCDEYNFNNFRIVKVLSNPINKGIHYSRIKGLKESSGDYIVFLDQDDIINENYFETQLKRAKNNVDIVVGNGIVQYPDYNKYLYKYYIMQWTVKYLWFYCKFDNRIISPGQCLIKRSSIPEAWINNVMKNNGSDDALLWWLMLYGKKRFAINRQNIYTHVNTGFNYSSDIDKMMLSIEEAVNIFSKYSKKKYTDLFRKLYFDKRDKSIVVRLVERLNKL